MTTVHNDPSSEFDSFPTITSRLNRSIVPARDMNPAVIGT